MIRTLFFDFGNVIAFFDHWRAVRQFERFTTLPGPEIYERLYDNKFEDAYERGLLTTPEYVAKAIADAELKLTKEELLAYFIDIFTPNAEVIDAIPRLAAQYRICLASNTNDAHFSHYTSQFAETFAHFSGLPTSHKCGHRKPERGYFEYCQTFAECEPGECLFLDDMAVNVAGAREFGWQAEVYTPGGVIPRLLETVR